jgi:hypothetical protein
VGSVPLLSLVLSLYDTLFPCPQDWSRLIGERPTDVFRQTLSSGFTDTVFVKVVLVGLGGEISERVVVSKQELQAIIAHEKLLSQSFHTFDGTPLHVNGSVHFNVYVSEPRLAIRIRDHVVDLLKVTSFLSFCCVEIDIFWISRIKQHFNSWISSIWTPSFARTTNRIKLELPQSISSTLVVVMWDMLGGRQ